MKKHRFDLVFLKQKPQAKHSDSRYLLSKANSEKEEVHFSEKNHFFHPKVTVLP